MGNFLPSFHIQTLIRKTIFEKFKELEIRFTNDQIFEIIKSSLDSSWTIDNIEEYFKEICDCSLVRNIAQNFTTQWFKLFDIIEKIHCNSCNHDIYLGKSEARTCYNLECQASI